MANVYANAAVVVAPSEFIQQELLDLFNVPLNKVVVAPLGADDAFAEPQPCMVEKPYLLLVGTTRPSKNVTRLRQALSRLRGEIPHSLVVVGKAGECEPEEWGAGVVRIERCPTAQLAGLYQHCDLFICASLYEGSGVTILEAMRAGARIVSSRVGGIPELADKVPTYLNHENVDSIVAAIRWALNETRDERDERTRAGQHLAAQYTWEQCALKTLSAFKRV